MDPARIIRLTLPTPYPVGDINAWWLDGDEPTLIDTGVYWNRSLAAVRTQLAAHGRRIEDVRRILLTHGHHDHAGAAYSFSQLADAPVYLHEQSSLTAQAHPERLEELLRFMGRCGLTDEHLALARTMFSHGPQMAAVDAEPFALETLRGCETLACGGVTLRALATPGHSPDHLCFVDEADGALFCGDMLLAHITPNPLLHLHPEDGYRRAPSLLQYIDSLHALQALHASVGYAGHGAVIAEVDALIERNLSFIDKRKQRYLAKLDHRPFTPFTLALAFFGKLDPMNMFLALSETVAYLDLLERDHAVAVAWEGEPITIRR